MFRRLLWIQAALSVRQRSRKPEKTYWIDERTDQEAHKLMTNNENGCVFFNPVNWGLKVKLEMLFKQVRVDRRDDGDQLFPTSLGTKETYLWQEKLCGETEVLRQEETWTQCHLCHIPTCLPMSDTRRDAISGWNGRKKKLSNMVFVTCVV